MTAVSGTRVPSPGGERRGATSTGLATPAAGVAAARHHAPYPQQPYPQPPYPQPGLPPGMLGAAHKPGAIALRPLQLGDIYDAAFRIIRFNPQATVGSAVLVTAVAMLIPVAVTALLTWSVNLSLDPGSDGFTGAETAGLIGTLGSWVLGSLLQSLGLVLVTGMVAHVTMAAAVGKKLTWERPGPRRPASDSSSSAWCCCWG